MSINIDIRDNGSAIRTGDSTITLLAHGSPDARHARDIERLACRLQELTEDFAVHVSYLDHNSPSPADTARRLRGSGTKATVVVPLLLAPAFHARVDVPASVSTLRSEAPDLQVMVTDPLGPDTGVIEAALELVARAGHRPTPDTGLALVATGSRDPRAVAAVERLITDHGTSTVSAFGWGAARAAYLDGGRHLGETTTLLTRVDGMKRVICVPFLLAEGVLRDRMKTSAHLLGLPFVPGALADTDAIARLALSRAMQVTALT